MTEDRQPSSRQPAEADPAPSRPVTRHRTGRDVGTAAPLSRSAAATGTTRRRGKVPASGQAAERDRRVPGAEPRPRRVAAPKPIIDEVDKRIIEHLQQDGRRPFTQIAGDLGLSESAVRARTNRLVEEGIVQIVGVTDPLKLGFAQMAMIGIRCEPPKLMAVAERIAAFPEVDYVVITAGRYDILIETVHEDNEALLRFLSEKLRTVDGVAETETFVYLRLVKQTYQWGTR